MVWLGGLFTLLSLVLWVYAFFDALTSPIDEVRNLHKYLWVVLIVLFPLLGSLCWLFFGRPRPSGATEPDDPMQPASADGLDPSDFQQPTERRGPLGPDDDPEFLRGLNKRINPEE